MAQHPTVPPTYGRPPLDWPHYGIGFGPAVKRFLTKYATFRGRASRGEYWWVVLLNVLVFVVYSTLLQAAGGLAPGAVGATPTANVILDFFRLCYLGVLLPNVALQVRRLHDTGRRGWWSLLNLVPLLGQIVLVVLCVDGTSPKADRFGPPEESSARPDGWAQGHQLGPDRPPYGDAPAHGAPPAYGAPPVHGAPAAYGPPAAYGAPAGYGPPRTDGDEQQTDAAQRSPEGEPRHP